MFEIFTDRARMVVVQAQDEARTRDHDYIGTEHLLLGLIHGKGLGPKALEAQGISLDSVRQSVDEAVNRGQQQANPTHIPFTPAAKEVLRLSKQESDALGHNYIGTEHILLGLIREGGGVAAQVLAKLGAELDGTRRQVVELLDEYHRRDG
jgi:ATP-dependent Clp protease ATP-binding subunit ClpC